ncbi:MAG: tetratricopeptide repeat protein [Gemmatimonadetes bacterium]|nr:tetratricopeptide repeat protein [Gemmatimonadota bacterium]MYB60851.1 tetratricopeptide repeat protein [Gemmatimonadota bacterium]
MRRTSLILFTLVCVIIGCAYYNTFYNARKAFKEGERIRLNQQTPDGGIPPLALASYELAVENAGLVLRDHSGSSYVDDALVLIGDVRSIQGQHLQAIKRYEQVLRLFPDGEFTGHCVFSLGNSLLNAGDSTRADEQLERFVREFPDSDRFPDALMLRGKIALGGARYGEAVARFQEVLETRPGDEREAEARYHIALARLEEHRFSEAREQLAHAIDQARTRKLKFQAAFMLGESLRREGDLPAALRTFESLLDQRAFSDYHPEVMLAIAACLAEMDLHDSAVSTYESLITYFESDRSHAEEVSRAMFELGELYRTAGDLDLTEQWYDEARRTSPRSFWVGDEADRKHGAIRELRRLDGNLGNLLAAMEAMKSSGDPDSNTSSNYAQLTEDAVGLRYQLAELYLFQLEMADSALSQYRAIEEASNDPSMAAKAAFARGWILDEMLNDTDNAGSVFDSIAVRYPGTAHAVEAAILRSKPIVGELPPDRLFAEAERLLFETDRPDSARGLYEMVLQRDPDGEYAPQALYALGWLAETHFDDPDTALDRYREIVERHPRSEQANSVRDKIRLMEELLPATNADPDLAPAPAPDPASAPAPDK